MKKILCISISLLLLVTMAIGASARLVGYEYLGKITTFDTYLLGDINEDKSINALDSLTLKSYVSGVCDDINESSADFDLDGKATSKDNLYLKACLAGVSEISSFENKQNVQLFSIAGNPISDYEIVLNDDFVADKDTATVADSILASYIRTATGVELNDVIGETNRTKPYMIRIDVIDPLGEREIPEDLGLEDYIYEVKDGNLYITGTLRGAMYAAYEIVEEYLGFRFITKDETTEYTARVTDIPEGTYVLHRTETNFRYNGQDSSTNSLVSHYYARKNNLTYVWGGCNAKYGYQTGSLFDCAHSFLSVYAMGSGYYNMLDQGFTEDEILGNLWTCWTKYGVQKPPYSWQPCTSTYGEGSDYEIMFKGLLLGLEMERRFGYEVDKMIDLGVLDIAFSICDNGAGCSCKICRAKMSGGTVTRMAKDKAEIILKEYTGECTYNEAKKEMTFKKESFNGTYLDFTNRAARDIKEYYPDATVWTIIYDFSIPESVKPLDNVSILYCGHGCIQHALGTGECGDNLTVLDSSNKINEVSMKWWSDTVHNAGGDIWFWSYGVNYTYYFLATPVIFEMYYNFTYLLNDCNFDGIFYEGCQNSYYNFEHLKGYLSDEINWNPHMTFDEYCDVMKEYLYLYYGEGNEELFQYITMQQEAGDATGECFITNHDRPWDMYSWQYLGDNYEEMRSLLETAYDKALTNDQKERVQLLIFSCDFMGLSSAYDRYWINGDAEHKAIFKDRMDTLQQYFLNNNLPISDGDVYPVPDELDYDICPMKQFYSMGAFRLSLIPDFAK